MTVSTPDQVAILAAASLDAMPPLPTTVPGPPATRSSCWSISTTSSMREASAKVRGSPVWSPGVSVSSTSSSAPTRWATRAASRSLSPKRISSSATASFSLTTGTTPSSSRCDRVPRARRYWGRWTKSRGASRIWPARRPWRPSRSCQTRIKSGWPTAETAWSTAGSEGRGPAAASADHPAAMAPDVTTTTRRPEATSPAIWVARRPTRSPSVRPSAPVIDEEPTLTTRVRCPGDRPPALTGPRRRPGPAGAGPRAPGPGDRPRAPDRRGRRRRRATR